MHAHAMSLFLFPLFACIARVALASHTQFIYLSIGYEP